MTHRIRLLICFFSLLVLIGCNNSEVVVETYDTGVAAPVDGGIVAPVDGGVVVEPETLADLVTTIAAEPEFQFFSEALELTQLNFLFSDESRAYTITVPTNAAFDALSTDDRIELFSNLQSLRQLLLRHVSPVVESNAEIVADGLTMLDGSERIFTDSQFVINDLEATNGVVHGINTILTEAIVDEEGASVLQVLSDDGQFSGLVAALELASVAGILGDQDQSLTLFAPTNSAFIALGQAAVFELYSNPSALADLLSYHIIPTAALEAVDFGDGLPVSFVALNGERLSLDRVDGQLRVNGVVLDAARTEASNGVIYVTDTVL